MASFFERIREAVKGIDIFPKTEISEEDQKEISKIISFVYADGSVSSPGMPSKKHQYNILAQIYSWDKEYKQYESLANAVYENAMSKENSYKDIINTPEIYSALRFAFEGIISTLIKMSKDKSRTREYFSGLDNLSDRLLLMNNELFKKLFILLHEYHFYFVYNQDESYKYTVRNIKQRLELCHGIKQTDFYKKIGENKDNVSYALYFAERAGEIIRVKDGRTYRLYLPEDNIAEIQHYEFSRYAATDCDFNYLDYWKKIESVLKANEGILQTEFYKKFDWDSEILTRSLRDAEKDGKVYREKKGNTYLLYSSKP